MKEPISFTLEAHGLSAVGLREEGTMTSNQQQQGATAAIDFQIIYTLIVYGLLYVDPSNKQTLTPRHNQSHTRKERSH